MRKFLIIGVSAIVLFITAILTGQHTDLGGGISYRLYPNHKLTPGDLATEWTIKDICDYGTKKYRDVSTFEKRNAAALYGLSYPTKEKVEYDHWVSLGSGGSNDVENIWPMPYPEYAWKDKVETYLNREVCTNRMSVSDARAITDNWYDFYKIHFAGTLGGIDENNEPVE